MQENPGKNLYDSLQTTCIFYGLSSDSLVENVASIFIIAICFCIF